MRDPETIVEDEEPEATTTWEDDELEVAPAVDEPVYDGEVPDGESSPADVESDDEPAGVGCRSCSGSGRIRDDESGTHRKCLDCNGMGKSDEEIDGPLEDAVESPPETVATIRWVPLGDLYVEYKYWTNPRRFTGLDPQSIKDLAADIAAKTRQVLADDSDEQVTYAGIDDPLHVVSILENGSVVQLVVDGQRRYRAVVHAYRNDLDVLVPVRDLEPEPVVWSQELSNRYLADSLKKVGLRAGLSAFELARNAEFLRAQRDEDTGKDYTLERIAGIIGRSESWCSKILSALKHATPKLIHKWETGAITEEQFRDLAAQKDPEEQEQATDAVVKARTSGDQGGGRTLAKEQLEIARASRTRPVPAAKPADAGKASKGGKKKGPAVKGPQTEMPAVAPRKPPPFAVVEDMMDTAAKKPPTHEYVKGMLDGVRWATGLLDAALLGKPWQQYLQRAAGSTASEPVKAAKPAKGKTKKRK